MSLAARLKMFEQAASDNGAGMRPGSAAPKRPTWGAARGPSLAEQIKKVRIRSAGARPLSLRPRPVPAWAAREPASVLRCSPLSRVP